MNQTQTNERHRAALAREIDARFETLIDLLHGPIPMVIRNGSAQLAQLYKEWALRVRKLTNETPPDLKKAWLGLMWRSCSIAKSCAQTNKTALRYVPV